MAEGATNGSDEQLIAGFVRDRILRDPSARVDRDDPLITSGVIDSFSLVDLRLFLEETFHVSIPDGDLTPDVMNTVAMIAARIDGLRRI